MQSLRLKRDALKLMNATVATSAMWSVLENYFGIEEDVEEKALEEAQSLAEILRIQRGDDKEDVPAMTKQQADSEEAAIAEEIEDAADSEDQESVPSSTTSSAVGVGTERKTLTALKKKAMDDFPTKCSISEAKIFYPTSSDSMHLTGVDGALIRERQSLPGYWGNYECNVGDCTYASHTHGVCTTHVHHSHLGYAVGCRFCPPEKVVASPLMSTWINTTWICQNLKLWRCPKV